MAEDKSSEPEAPAPAPSLTDALNPMSLKPSWMSGSGTSSGFGAALAKSAAKSEESAQASKEEVTSFGICDKGRYGYKGRHSNGYGQRNYGDKRTGGKRNARDRREARDPSKEKWERGVTSPREKEHSNRERHGRREFERGRERKGGGSTRSPRYAEAAHSVSPRTAGSAGEETVATRRGSLPANGSSQGGSSVTQSPRKVESDPVLERARALVPSQPVVPKKGGKSRGHREKRNDKKKKRTTDYYYPNRPPSIKVDVASLQPLTQLTSPRYLGALPGGASPRSPSPSPSPRGAVASEESKVPLSSGSRKARTSFFDSLRARDEQSGQGGRCQLSMRSADDLLMAGKPSVGSFARKQPALRSSTASKPRGAMAKGTLGIPSGSPSMRQGAGGRTGSNDSLGSSRSVNSSDSDRMLISEEDEEEEQRFLKEMGWTKDEVADSEEWQLTAEEIERTRKEMLDKNLSLKANVPLSRMQYFQQFQKNMPSSVATASSPALLRFATRKVTASTKTANEQAFAK